MTVSVLKPKSEKGPSTGLLVQSNVFCLGSGDPGCHLGAARLQALWLGIWKTPKTCRAVKCLALQQGASEPGALSALASAQTTGGLSKMHQDKALFNPGRIHIPPMLQNCHWAPDPEARLSHLQPPTENPGSCSKGTSSFLKASQGWPWFSVYL